VQSGRDRGHAPRALLDAGRARRQRAAAASCR
jgi:hypothetical protein